MNCGKFTASVRNVNLDGFIHVIVVIAVVLRPHGVPLLADFVGLHRAEAIFIKKHKQIVCNRPLRLIEDREYIVWLQQLMYGKIHSMFIYICIYYTIDLRENKRYV